MFLRPPHEIARAGMTDAHAQRQARCLQRFVTLLRLAARATGNGVGPTIRVFTIALAPRLRLDVIDGAFRARQRSETVAALISIALKDSIA